MKSFGPVLICLLSLVLCASCGNKAVDENDAIREGINEHLATVKTINMSAMDMNLTNVTIQDNKAQAQVSFLAKGAAPGSVGMQVAYSLEKQNGKWAVVNAQPTGGLGQQDASGPSPDSGSSPQGGVPDFSNLIHGAQPGNSFPPGHPAVNPQGGAVAPAQGGSPH